MVQAVGSKASKLMPLSGVQDSIIESAAVQGAPDTGLWRVARGVLSFPVMATLTGSVAVGFLMVYFYEPLARLGNWGYLGVFLAQFADGAIVFIPTPGQVYSFGVASTLQPVMLGVIGGIGGAFGELVAYYLGTRAHNSLNGGRLYEKLLVLTKRGGGLALFLGAVLPGPFEMMSIWAGTVRYPLWRFLLYVTPGKIIKVMVVTIAGYYSISWMF
ncbi:MAG: VTT domain-containing protein [Chloroflexi bacterium]|nr:VTT domain-containing protein [Chloroflexota bacterium]